MRKFHLICGLINELHISTGSEDFIYSKLDKNALDIAAIGAVLAEQSAASAVLASNSGGEEITMEYFKCMINQIELNGRFYKVEFSNGEEIEFVGEYVDGVMHVHAARSRFRRVIWMLPHQIRGSKAQIKTNVKAISLFCAAIALGTALFNYLMGAETNLEDSGAIVLMVASISFIIAVFIAFRFYPFSKQATEIFQTFGFTDPAQLDLKRISKALERKIHADTGDHAVPMQPWSFRF